MRKFILFIGVMVVVFSSGCDEKTFTLLAEDDSARVVEDGSVIIDVLANDIAPEGEEKSILSATNGTYGDVEIVDNTIRYTAKDGYVGRDTFTYILQGSNDVTDEASVTMIIFDGENQVPYAMAGKDRSMELSQTITIVGKDRDNDGIIVNQQWTNTTEVLARTRIFEYIPTSLGTKVLTYTVKDNEGASASDSMNVFVSEPTSENHAPVASNLNIVLPNCDISSSIDIQLQAIDADDDALIYSIITDVTYGVLELIDADTGMARFSINDSESNGKCMDGMLNSFTFKANDTTVDSNTATINLALSE